MAEKKKNAKKLTVVQLRKEQEKIRAIEKVELNIGGTEYYYEIDNNPTTTKTADFVQNVKALVGYVSTEPEFDGLTDEETTRFLSAMILAEIMNIFSTLEVEETIEGRVQFIAQLNDLDILQPIADRIPEGLKSAIESAESSISELVNNLTNQAEEIRNKIVDLEKIKIIKENEELENETEGE